MYVRARAVAGFTPGLFKNNLKVFPLFSDPSLAGRCFNGEETTVLAVCTLPPEVQTKREDIRTSACLLH